MKPFNFQQDRRLARKQTDRIKGAREKGEAQTGAFVGLLGPNFPFFFGSGASFPSGKIFVHSSELRLPHLSSHPPSPLSAYLFSLSFARHNLCARSSSEKASSCCLCYTWRALSDTVASLSRPSSGVGVGARLQGKQKRQGEIKKVEAAAALRSDSTARCCLATHSNVRAGGERNEAHSLHWHRCCFLFVGMQTAGRHSSCERVAMERVPISIGWPAQLGERAPPVCTRPPARPLIRPTCWRVAAEWTLGAPRPPSSWLPSTWPRPKGASEPPRPGVSRPTCRKWAARVCLLAGPTLIAFLSTWLAQMAAGAAAAAAAAVEAKCTTEQARLANALTDRGARAARLSRCSISAH